MMNHVTVIIEIESINDIEFSDESFFQKKFLLYMNFIISSLGIE